MYPCMQWLEVYTSPWEDGVSAQGRQTPPRQTPPGRHSSLEMDIEAGGTHPTGMHFCITLIYITLNRPKTGVSESPATNVIFRGFVTVSLPLPSIL